MASLEEAWQLETSTAPIHHVLVSLYLRTVHPVSQQQQQQQQEEEHGKRKSKAQKFEKSGKQQRQTIEGERQRERERKRQRKGRTELATVREIVRGREQQPVSSESAENFIKLQ